MSLAQELNELFRYGRTYSVQKFAEGWGRGVGAAVDAFGTFDIVRSGGTGEGSNRWLIVYRFSNRPDELVGIEGFNDNGILDLQGSLFFDVKVELDTSGIFPVYTKAE